MVVEDWGEVSCWKPSWKKLEIEMAHCVDWNEWNLPFLIWQASQYQHGKNNDGCKR